MFRLERQELRALRGSRSQVYFIRDANAKKRKAKALTPDGSGVKRESALPRPMKTRKAERPAEEKTVPDASLNDTSDDEGFELLPPAGPSSRTDPAVTQVGGGLVTSKPCTAKASTSETPNLCGPMSEASKSGTSKPEKPSLEDIQRYRRKLHRRLESSLAFLSKAQPELHPDGGREIAALPDLLKEIVEDLDEVRNTAQGLLRELD